VADDKKFSLLRNLLRAIGLPQESVDEIVDWIAELLAGEGKGNAKTIVYPYQMRGMLLSDAELKFFDSLKKVTGENVYICTKVGLSDIFIVKSNDQSQYRIYTNKIDRKHVDFLICDKKTMRPLVGLELDDKSHQREDRRARDAFVDEVFKAAKLPIVHIPAKRDYSLKELGDQLSAYIGFQPSVSVVTPTVQVERPVVRANNPSTVEAPVCPQCGGQMFLRTAKKGDNAGNSFWGCGNYPKCRGVISYQG
jgi:hypothetical protein